MNSDDLISLLSRYPGIPIVVNAGKNELANGKDIVEVELITQYRGKGEEIWSVCYFPEVIEAEPDQYEVRKVLNIHSGSSTLMSDN